MKTFTTIRITTVALALLALFTVQGLASTSDYYLQIDKINGETRSIRCADGVCSIDDLTPGDYKITVVDKNGKLRTDGKFSVTATITAPKDTHTGLSTGMRSASATKSEIVSPRDPASGLPTGQRMHKPFVITKELDKASPQLAFSTPKGPDNADVAKWTIEIRVQKIEMK